MENNNTLGEPEAQAIPRDTNGVSWTASEFIAHEKSAGWYVNLVVATLVLSALLYFITRDVVSVVAVLFGALFFGIFAARKPRQLDYRIENGTVQVGAKIFPLQAFKSFSAVQEGQFSAINFMPLQRFSPVLTIYVAPEQAEQILTILSNYLPFEEAQPDRVESLMRRIRF